MADLLDVVDEQNKVVGEAPIQQIYDLRLNHRVVHVLIFNDKGEIFLQQRSADKEFCPAHWITSAGGCLRRNESYEEAAKRELLEQLGIATDLVRLDESAYDHYKMRKFMQVFRAIHSGPFMLDKRNVMSGRWFSVSDVKDMVNKHQFVHPELAHVINRLYKQ